MKKCIVEIMKDIKELEDEKEMLILFENRGCKSRYIKGEDPVPTEYDFNQTREDIKTLDNKIRKLRFLLNKANNQIFVEEVGMSLGECLVYLSQLNNEKFRVSSLIAIQPISKELTRSGIVEYTKANFSRDEAKEIYKKLNTQISRLQILIDRNNLMAEIEV